VERLEARVWWMGKWMDGDSIKRDSGVKVELKIKHDCEMDGRRGVMRRGGVQVRSCAS
jgi:hypothetical protein